MDSLYEQQRLHQEYLRLLDENPEYKELKKW